MNNVRLPSIGGYGTPMASSNKELEYSCRLRTALASSPAKVEEVICFFEKIADEEGWQPDGEVEAHVERSTYFGLWSGNHLIGGLQIVHPTEDINVLPCHKVWPELSVASHGKIAHIAMMAVEKAYRGSAASERGAAFWELAVAMWRYCVTHGIQQLFLEATPRTLRCYQRLGWPLTICGPLRLHWGEECYPCSLSVREVAGSLTERALRSQQYHQLLVQAIRHVEVD